MWGKLNPVRNWVYSVLAPVFGVLVYYGIVEDQAVTLWTSLAGAVLGVTATEVARAKVRPVSKDE
jgi:uncharacterized membrane protein YjjB (DUF3815 family)